MPVYGGPPTELPANIVTALEALIDGTAPNARIKADGTIQFKNEDTAKYDTPHTGGGDLAQYLQFDDHSQT